MVMIAAPNANLQSQYQRQGFNGGNKPTPKWPLVVFVILVLSLVAYLFCITTGII